MLSKTGFNDYRKNNSIRFIDRRISLPGASGLRLIISETTTRISFLKIQISLNLFDLINLQTLIDNDIDYGFV